MGAVQNECSGMDEPLDIKGFHITGHPDDDVNGVYTSASGLYHWVCRRCLLRKFRQQLEASTRNASLFFCIEMAECHLSRPMRAPGVIFPLYYVLGVIFRTTYWPSVIFRRVHGPGVIFRYSATPGVIFGQKGTLCDNF